MGAAPIAGSVTDFIAFKLDNVLLEFNGDWYGLGVVLNPLIELIAGKVTGANRPVETGTGDGAGDKDDIGTLLREPRLWDDNGVATGLGVELKAVLLIGFKIPALYTGKVVFCPNGTKVDVFIDIFIDRRIY